MSLSDIAQLVKLWNWALKSWKRMILVLIMMPFAICAIYLFVYVKIEDRWQFTMDLYFRILKDLGFGYNWAVTYQTEILVMAFILLTVGIIDALIFLFAMDMVKKAEDNAYLKSRLKFIEFAEFVAKERGYVSNEMKIKYDQESFQHITEQFPPDLGDKAREVYSRMSRN